MRVIYSFVGKLASKGNGELAYYIIKPFFDRGYLRKIITTSFAATEIPESLFYYARTGVIHGLKLFPWADALNYVVRDNIFDFKASRLIVDCDLFIGWSHASLFSLRIAKKLKAKTVVFSGSTHVLTQSRLLRDEYKRFGVKLAKNWLNIRKHLKEYEEADYISVYSDFVVNSFLENGIPKEKLIFVPYGIDTDRYKPAQKNDDVFRVLSIGSICLRKGIQYLLEAWSRLKLKNSELVLVGSIDRQMLNIIKDYKKRCSFKLAGFASDLNQYYPQASVVVCASVEEGSTAIAYEALSCGVPVIASTNAGVDHIIKDGVSGFIIPVRNVDAIEEKIRFSYNNREVLSQMAKSAREDMVKNHSYEKYAKEIVSTYEKLI